MAARNRLASERSPYLLQHAANPVDWYPWGEEAFDKAREENMPIFLSVGYSTCHWCHVMERESFEKEDVSLLGLGTFDVCLRAVSTSVMTCVMTCDSVPASSLQCIHLR
jgi:hypothetical protein